MREIVHI